MENLINFWWQQFGDCDDAVFANAIQCHVDNPDDGRFFPTVAHIRKAMFGTEADLRVQAALDFDKNPRIDGCSSYDESHENHYMRDLRKKRYIEYAARRWRHSDNAAKIEYKQTGQLPNVESFGDAVKIKHKNYAAILEGKKS